MKARIKYINGIIETIIENSKTSFEDFCLDLFKQKIYLSIVEEGHGVSMAINTDNILFVEEINQKEE